MTFPTIPTAGAGRIIFLNQLNITATLTSPDLSTLTFDAGDTLIAIAGEYQSNAGADAAFTGWAGGGLTWTEIRDSTGTTNNRMGVAVTRSVSGSETGTVTVTRSGTLVGDASIMILAVPGGHASTNAEATVMASTATPPADPVSLSPSWGASDTLWIAVGSSGCTAIAGTWTAIASAPTNYTDYQSTSPSDTSTIGDFGLAVAFRQSNAASEDTGTFTQDTSNARSAALTIAVRPAPAIVTGTSVSHLGFTGSAVGNLIGPAVSGFVDDFTTEDSAKWSNYSASKFVTSGRVQFDVSAIAGYQDLAATQRWNLTGDSIFVEVVEHALVDYQDTMLKVTPFSADRSVDIGWVTSVGSNHILYMRYTFGSQDATSLTLDETAHRFVRLREASGTVYWETSPTGAGGTWTTQRSVVLNLAGGWDFQYCEIILSSGHWQNVASPTADKFDNLNLAAVSTSVTMAPMVAPSRPVRSWR